MKRKGKKLLIVFLVILLIGLIIPQNLKMPVQGASKADYNSKSFWFYPWGKSITHKGVDIFAKKGTPVYASTIGLVLSARKIKRGGNFVLILGPKWRLHYYAHLNKINVNALNFITKKSIIGTVGTSGNAVGKSPHLHYSIVTPIPYFGEIDTDKQGWKKMFYLNPIQYLEE